MLWNSLPQVIVEADRITRYKKKLDSHVDWSIHSYYDNPLTSQHQSQFFAKKRYDEEWIVLDMPFTYTVLLKHLVLDTIGKMILDRLTLDMLVIWHFLCSYDLRSGLTGRLVATFWKGPFLSVLGSSQCRTGNIFKTSNIFLRWENQSPSSFTTETWKKEHTQRCCPCKTPSFQAFTC